jgi:hypothetical protein
LIGEISLSAERRREAPSERAEALQAFLCGREGTLNLPEDPNELFRQMRKHLVDASDEGHLAMKAHDVIERLKWSPSPIGK